MILYFIHLIIVKLLLLYIYNIFINFISIIHTSEQNKLCYLIIGYSWFIYFTHYISRLLKEVQGGAQADYNFSDRPEHWFWIISILYIGLLAGIFRYSALLILRGSSGSALAMVRVGLLKLTHK